MIVSTTGLEAYWSFNDESSRDYSGNSRDLANLTNMTWAAGASGTALYLPDRTVVRAAYGAAIDFSTKTALSISFWANKTAINAGNNSFLISFGLVNVDGFAIYNNINTDSVTIQCGRAGATEYTATTINAFDATMRHYVFTFDLSSNAWILYRDAVSFASGTLTNTPVMPNRSLVLGGNNTPVLATTWIGLIDEVRLYSRVLTPTEVGYLYADPGQTNSGGAVRQQIMSAVTSALSDITVAGGSYNSTIAHVSESIKAYNEIDMNKLPACFPIDADESKEHQTFSGSGDMAADLTVIVTSMLYARTGVTSTMRGNLLRDIEKAMVTASQLSSITSLWMVEVTKVTTDQGTIPMYSIHDQEVHFHYYYQSTDGG